MNIILNVIGIVVILACVYALSYNRKAIDRKLVIKALIAQLVLGFIVIKVPAGVWVIEAISNFVTMVTSYGKDGLSFVFGSLVDPKAAAGFIFVIQVLGNIIFIGALVSILQYIGLLGWVIDKLGKLVGRLIGSSNLETFVSVANMFLGQTESPLLISKYIHMMTRSELIMVLVAGMGSMSVSILAGYHALGIPMQYLILASAMVPFGSIAIGKMLLPELEEPKEVKDIKVENNASNLIEALSNGAMDGVQMVIAIAASLVAINAVVALINGGLGYFGVSLQQILGIVFYPFSFLMGLGDNTVLGGQLLGCKFVLNEFVAYDMFVKVMGAMDARSVAVLSIGIAGFANIGSMAVCLSGLGALCPGKKASSLSLSGGHF